MCVYIYCVNKFSFSFGFGLMATSEKLCMFKNSHARHKANVYFVSAIYQIGLNDTSSPFTFDAASI